MTLSARPAALHGFCSPTTAAAWLLTTATLSWVTRAQRIAAPVEAILSLVVLHPVLRRVSGSFGLPDQRILPRATAEVNRFPRKGGGCASDAWPLEAFESQTSN